MEDQIITNKKPLPFLASVIVALCLIAGAFWIFTINSNEKMPPRAPDVAGLLNGWRVDGSKAYAIIIPSGKKSVKQAITLDPSTKYIHRKGKKSDADRKEEAGALANIAEGLYVGVYFKEGTQIADSIVYANWPL